MPTAVISLKVPVPKSLEMKKKVCKDLNCVLKDYVPSNYDIKLVVKSVKCQS